MQAEKENGKSQVGKRAHGEEDFPPLQHGLQQVPGQGLELVYNGRRNDTNAMYKLLTQNDA